MDSMCSGKTCIACAKAKIKCDKNLPSCSRCVRLGIDCHSQSRGRGRPKGVVAIKPQQSDEFCDKPTTIQVKQKELPRAAIQKKRNFPKNLMMLESIKSALQEEAQNGIKEEALMKACAVTNWLFHLACCTKSEDMYDSVSGIWEVYKYEYIYTSLFIIMHIYNFIFACISPPSLHLFFSPSFFRNLILIS